MLLKSPGAEDLASDHSDQESMSMFVDGIASEDEQNGDDANNGLKHDFRTNYKKKKVETSEEPLAKRQNKRANADYSVGTTKDKESILYSNTNNIVNALENYSTEPVSLTEYDFKQYEKAKKVLKRLKDLEQKEQIVKLLSPKEFRFKMFLEEVFTRLTRRFLRFTAADMRHLQREYRGGFCKERRLRQVERQLEDYRKKVEYVQKQCFSVVPYVPGSTPWHMGRKYLAMNKYGVVWIETKTSKPMVTFNTYDKSIRSNFWFNVDDTYDLGCITRRGLLLADSGYYMPGEDAVDTLGMRRLKRYVLVLYKSHDGSVDSKIVVELLRGEYISTVSLSNDVINVFLSSGLVKKYSSFTSLPVHIEKGFPTICSLADDSLLFNISVKDPYNYQFLYTIQSTKDSSYLVLNQPLTLPARSCIHTHRAAPRKTSDLLRGVLFSDFGQPCYVGSDEYLYCMAEIGNGFVPLLNVMESFNEFNSAHNNLMYYPFSLSETSLQVIIIKDAVLSNKLQLVQDKIGQAQREIRAIRREIKDKEKQEQLDQRRKKVVIVDQPEIEATKAPSVSEKLSLYYEKTLARNQQILRNCDAYIVESEKKKDYFSESQYNYPWFPLPGLNNFKIKLPVTTAQLFVRNTRFNDPKLTQSLHSKSTNDLFGDDNIDSLFDHVAMDYDALDEKDARFNKVISQPDHDTAHVNSQFFINSYNAIASTIDVQDDKRVQYKLHHDSNLVKLFHELVMAKKYKLAFHLVKSLKLIKSFKAIDKICAANGDTIRLGKAIEYWRVKKMKSYKALVGDK